MNYGQLPKVIGHTEVNCPEMMFYQYLPIKLSGSADVKVEKRLLYFDTIIGKILCDYIGTFGLDMFFNNNIYLSCKRMWQDKNIQFNRAGFHSDSFMSEDINYLWSDSDPTIFNKSNFRLTQDDSFSLIQMTQQARKVNDVTYPNNSILRLNQYVIHKVNDQIDSGHMRTFVKVSFSKDRYDLIGNAHNYELDYNWEMKPRKVERNIPHGNVK